MILRENAFFFAGAAESLMPNGGGALAQRSPSDAEMHL